MKHLSELLKERKEIDESLKYLKQTSEENAKEIVRTITDSKEVLNTRMQDILKQRIVWKTTYSSIAKKYNVSIGRIHQQYWKAIEKLDSYYF